MQDRIAAIVPGSDRTDAAANAVDVFETLTNGGTAPVYRSFTLIDDLNDPTGNSLRTGTHPLDSPEGTETVEQLWESTVTDLEILMETAREHADSAGTPALTTVVEPGSVAYARAHHLYDAAARPVLTKRQFNRVQEQTDRWVVNAFAEY